MIVEREKIVIIQGALSGESGFPSKTWREEFPQVKAMGIQNIQLRVSDKKWHLNPVMTQEGQAELGQLMTDNEIRARSIYADVFEEKSLNEENSAAVEIFKKIITEAYESSITTVEFPVFIEGDEQGEAFVNNIEKVLAVAETFSTTLAMDCNLEAVKLAELLQAIDHPLLKAGYSTDRAKVFEYDPRVDVEALSKWIHIIHINEVGPSYVDDALAAVGEYSYDGLFVLNEPRETAEKAMNYILRF